jgi:hypothetical protein
MLGHRRRVDHLVRPILSTHARFASFALLFVLPAFADCGHGTSGRFVGSLRTASNLRAAATHRAARTASRDLNVAKLTAAQDSVAQVPVDSLAMPVSQPVVDRANRA